MKISFIIPCYNASKYIERCINSIRSQNLSDYEIIAINDGSTDDTFDVLNNIQYSQLKVINKPNEGVSITRNRGLDIATGDVVMFVDADDYIIDGTLYGLDTISIESIPDLVIYGLVRKAKDGIERAYERESKTYHNEEILDFIRITDALPIGSPCAKLFKRSILNNNSVRFKPGQKLFEDACFVFNYLKHCKTIEFSNKNIYFYDTSGSVSSGFYGDIFFRDFDEYINSQTDLVKHFATYLNNGADIAVQKTMCEINKRNSFLHIAEIYKLYRNNKKTNRSRTYWLKKIIENANIKTPGWYNNMYTYPPLLITRLREHPLFLSTILYTIFTVERLIRRK